MNLIFDFVNKSLLGKDIDDLDTSELNLKDVNKLIGIIKRNEIDFEILHLYGSGCDDKALPHHVSTELEISEMVEKFGTFIKKYFLSNSVKPALVTVARSSLDDYCPTDQVDFIQKQILDILKNSYGKSVALVDLNY